MTETTLVDKVANAITLMDCPTEHDYDIAKNAIAIVLREIWEREGMGSGWVEFNLKRYAADLGIEL